MTKTFCDICKTEISKRDQQVNVGVWGGLMDIVSCIECFTKKTNWKLIQKIIQNKKPQPYKPLALRAK